MSNNLLGIQFHLMAKPVGPICNLNCKYCYYLSKKKYFSNKQNVNKDNTVVKSWLMSDDLLVRFIDQYINAQNRQEINFTWQGGEPTLAGIEFFEKVIELQTKYCPAGKVISNELQTNGTLIDEEWCKFLYKHNFLVGLSVDGPKRIHDKYRYDAKHQSSFDSVYNCSKLFNKYKIDFNTLTVVYKTSASKPLDIYKFLRNDINSKYMQFIPCVDRIDFASESMKNIGEVKIKEDSPIVTEWSVEAEQYGQFLCKIFERWYKNDVGKIFVLNFEASLNRWMGRPSPICYNNEICGKSLAIEHDGTVYSCDHFVYPEYNLGNIKEHHISKLAASGKQIVFGLSKRNSLPKYCRVCSFLFACNGGCPKNRIIKTPDGEPGLNYLCNGFKKYFSYIDVHMKSLTEKVQLR